MAMEVHAEAAARAVHHIPVLAHLLAIEGEHLVLGVVTLKFQRAHFQAKERAGNVNVRVVALIVTVFSGPGSGVKRQTGVLHVGLAFTNAERAERGPDVDILVLLPVSFVAGGYRATE